MQYHLSGHIILVSYIGYKKLHYQLLPRDRYLLLESPCGFRKAAEAMVAAPFTTNKCNTSYAAYAALPLERNMEIILENTPGPRINWKYCLKPPRGS